MNRAFAKLGLVFSAVGLVCGGICQAGPVTLTNSWQAEPFTLMNAGDQFPTAYFAPSAGSVLLTGYYVTGDYYSVYVDGKLVLTTTPASTSGVDYGDQTPSLFADPASGFASGLFSAGEFKVTAGDFITIADLNPPGGIGEAAIEYVPEPGSFGLLTTFALLGWFLSMRGANRSRHLR